MKYIIALVIAFSVAGCTIGVTTDPVTGKPVTNVSLTVTPQDFKTIKRIIDQRKSR